MKEKEEMIMTHYYITVDTETTGGFAAPEVYDLGIVVSEAETGRIIETADFVIEEIFYDDHKMKSAYYAEKIPQYYAEIKNGVRQAVSFRQARAVLLTLMREYNVQEVWAYNASFDSRALENTSKLLLGSSFFPATMTAEWKCSLKLWRETIGATDDYKQHADRTPKGFVSNKAESAYRYVSHNPAFVEAHTGKKDAEIETEILFACLAFILEKCEK